MFYSNEDLIQTDYFYDMPPYLYKTLHDYLRDCGCFIQSWCSYEHNFNIEEYKKNHSFESIIRFYYGDNIKYYNKINENFYFDLLNYGVII
jgi:hypothetical protein